MDEETRTLRMEIPGTQVQKLAGEPLWSNTTDIGEWSVIGGVGLALSWSGTIDLAGYTRQMKTFYPQAGMLQQGSHMAEPGNAGSILYTIVSTTPLNDVEVLTNLVGGGGQGFLSTFSAPGNQNWETVLFAESQLLVTNANILPNPLGILQTLSSYQSGSLAATAVNTLFCMKIMFPFATTQTGMMVAPSRILLPGKFGTEPDVEYMMRLKRGVELSQQV